MPIIEFEDPGPLTDPVLVVSFDGWVNAGNAGTAAAEQLMGDGVVIGHGAADDLFDYRAARPTALFNEGVLESVEFPEVVLVHREAQGRDVLVLSGTEPNWNWQRFGKEMGALAVNVGVVEHISLGGIPWAIPHTRMTTMIETASQRDLVPQDGDHPEGLLRAPASVMSVLEWFVADRGIPTRGFWARVPHYVGATYWPAAVALVERVGAHLGISFPYGLLVENAEEQRRRLDEILENQPEVRSVVERLEAMNPDEAPSGDELAAEIERFLQQRGDDGWGTEGS